MPPSWVNAEDRSDAVHVLCYPFLFPGATIVSYFRAINYASMCKAYNESRVFRSRLKQLTFDRSQTVSTMSQSNDRLRIAHTQCLVLQVRRDSVLEDAMDQLWMRQHRELLRPLKVNMGFDEGEEGVDQGGVQQEFFRVVLAEAMNPQYGM